MNQNNIQVATEEEVTWYKAIHTSDVPEGDGVAVKINGNQIAVFNFSFRKEWFATQNLCPHKKQMILSRGMIGDKNGEPKVACPFHKKSFSLHSGECLSGEDYKIKTYPVKIEDGFVFVGL